MAIQTFTEYTAQARDEFSRFINHQKWDGELRTKCEDLLIAYDQMKSKCDLEESAKEPHSSHIDGVSDSALCRCNKDWMTKAVEYNTFPYGDTVETIKCSRCKKVHSRHVV